MEKRKLKTTKYYLRLLHRDIGFLLIGLILVYSISGIVLVYRDTDFLKREAKIEKTLTSNMNAAQLGKALHIRNFRVSKSEGDILFFKNGTYNTKTGFAAYTAKELIFPLNKFVDLHKASSTKATHWLTVIFGVLMLFMAISSFWMFKTGTNLFRRGLYLSGFGFLLAFIALIA